MMRSGRFLAAMLCVLVACTGCGGDRHLAGDTVADIIETKLAPAYASEGPVEVSCPSSVPAEVGADFECTMRIAGAAVPIGGSVTGDDGSISFAPTKPLVLVDQIEDDLVAQLHDVYDEPRDTVDVSVDCPGPAVRIEKVGATFRCQVVVDGSRLNQEVSVVDRAGNVAYRALE